MKQSLHIFYLVVFFLGGSGVFAQYVMDPDDFHGPRTKWAIYPTIDIKNSRHTIPPYTGALSVSEFMNYLEKVGANAATMNLENRSSIASNPKHAIYELDSLQIAKAEYNVEQRNVLLTDFLVEVRNAVDRGEINGNIRFHIHQRLYPRKNAAKESEFIKDFSDFINLAKFRGVDQFIAGIRLGEHGTDGSKYLLQFSLKVCEAINKNTDGWLKEKGGFEMSGDGYGRDFGTIGEHGVTSDNFFEEISKHTGYFTFCYKAFDVGNLIQDAGLSKTSVSVWENFLLNNLGHQSLIDFIKKYRDAYPNHANVIFIGDSGDAMKLIKDVEYTANTNIYGQLGAGFTGITCINGIRRPDKGTADDYLYFFDAEGHNPPIEKPQSIKRWKCWPIHDGKDAALKTIYSGGTINGLISPSGPQMVLPGSEVTFTAVPFNGASLVDLIVDGVSVGSNTSYTFSDVRDNHSIQAIFSKQNSLQQEAPIPEEMCGKWQQINNAQFYYRLDTHGTLFFGDESSGAEVLKGNWWYNKNADGEFGSGKMAVFDGQGGISKVWDFKRLNAENAQFEIDYSDGNKGVFTRIVSKSNGQHSDLFSLFPNPSSGTFTVYCESSHVNEVHIFDQMGQLVFSRSFVGKLCQITHNLSPGFYVVRFSNRGEFMSRILYVQNP